MMNPWLAYLRLAQSATEIGWAAPQVVQKRSARLFSGRPWGAAEHAEALQMVLEKVQAAQAAQMTLWQRAMGEQQRLWLATWSGAAAGRLPRAPTRRALQRGAGDLANLATRMLAPTRRRVKANAKRLRRS
jgi:hypothetical protein